MQNLHAFVDQAAQRGGNPTRQQIGQAARVNVKRGHHPNTGQKQDPARAHILREGVVNNQVLRGAFDDSVYDGETITSKSHVQVEDSQLDAHGRPMGHPNHTEVGEEESSSEDEFENGPEYEERGEEEQEIRPQGIQQSMNNLLNQMGPGIFDPRSGDSYPPTTSGHPDDEEYEDEEPSSPQQMNKLSAPPHHFQRESRVSGMPPLASPSTHQMPLSRPPQMGRFSQAPATQPQHMMRQNLAHRQSPTPPIHKAMQRQTIYANPTPPQTGPYFAGHGTAQPKSRSDTGGSPRPKSQATVRVSTPQHEPRPEPEKQLDYNQDALSKMSYEELHNQDFDDNPAKPVSILSKQEANKSLPYRLAAVQQMEDDKKRDFLASLSLDEWEEAGDWFLERFGQVMNKMKEARKERRRLTKGFEEEVYKRHEKVQGKKRDIDEAMSEMSRNGQEVLRAGTPGRKKVKS